MSIAALNQADSESDEQATRSARADARHLPGRYYTAPDVFRQEREAIFLKRWLCVGREEELADAGDYLTLRVMGEPVLVVRDSLGRIAALSNVCRHRGVEVAHGAGNARHFSCPYHAWVYDLTGRLVGAPLMRGTNFDQSACRLPAFRADTWNRWIFVCLDAGAPPLEEAIAPFARQFDFLQPQHCRLSDKLVIDLNCNWKFACENLMDIYHVGTIHAKTFGGSYKGDKERYSFNLLPDGGFSFFCEAAPTTPDGKLMFDMMPWIADRGPNFAALGFLGPNMNYAARSESQRMWVTWPLAEDRSRLIVYSLLPTDAFKQPDQKEKSLLVRGFLEKIVDEDRAMLESLQNGVGSRMFAPGPFARLEEPIHHMINDYLARVAA